MQHEFNKENQTKKIEYINLKNLYNKPISEKKIEEVFNKNKEFYTEDFKDFKYAELTPLNIIGENEYNESFFNKINLIENEVLDNVEFNKLASAYNLNINNTGLVNEKNKNIDKKISSRLNEKI